jgi:hypothetical protein
VSLPFYPINEKTINSPKIKTNLFLDVYNFLSTNKQFTINNSQLIRKLLRLDDGIDVNEHNWTPFKLSLKNIIINQNICGDFKKIKVPIKIIYGDLDLFSFSETINQLTEFSNVDIVRVKGVSHIINKAFADRLLEEISK